MKSFNPLAKMLDAIKIKGVLNYSISYFFIKFTTYGWLLLLPVYLAKERGMENH